ncbi:MAG: ATP-binding protein [Pedobacter sp.]
MNKQRQRLAYNGNSVALLIVLIIAGFVGNYFALRLFTGFDYLFGSIPVLLVVRLFGIRWGLLAGVVASSWTITLFGHPYAMIWLCGEPLFIGWLLAKGRTRNILLYDTLYWPFLGAPLIWCFFQYIMHVSFSGTVAAMLVYWVIGICNALIASLLLATAGEPEINRSIPIQQLIFNLLMAIVVIPVIVILILNGKDTEQRYLNEMYDNLEDTSRIALYEIKLKLQKQGVAIAVPFTSRGILQGYAAPGIRVDVLKNLLLNARVRQYQQITLVDGTGKVITSTNSALSPLDFFNTCKNGSMSRVTSNNIYRCLPSPNSPMPFWQRAQRSNYNYILSAPMLDATSWNVVVETPFAPYQQQLFKEHIKSLLVALCLNMLALATSLTTSRRLAAPLRRLSQVTTDLPQRLLREKINIWPESMVTEIDQLIGNFRVMTTALSQKFQEITYANETLELRVVERTKELVGANKELQKEIAERKLIERQRDHLTDELVNQVHFLQTLINAIPNPVFYKDSSGHYQGCNRAFEECLGVSYDKIVGKSVHDIFPIHMADMYLKSDQELFERRGVQVYEAQMCYADGLNHAVVFYNATYDDTHGNIGGGVGTIVDITERKQAEAERNHLMLELKQKNKELEGIVYVASHDLRSPLVNVQGFSRKLVKNCAELDRILSGLDLDVATRMLLEPILRGNIPKSLGFITGSIEKIDSLLSALVRLSRLGRAALCFDNLDMQDIMAKIVDSMTYQIEASGARIELGPLGACFADREQVIQVFSNLLDNAIKYRSPERPLLVRVFREEFAEGVRYCVEDNGIGIPHDHQDKIWEIFQRLNPGDSEGDGLGLTLVRRIIDRLGGSIWVESEPGQGSRFYVVFLKQHDVK